jgi:hypothetical protein
MGPIVCAMVLRSPFPRPVKVGAKAKAKVKVRVRVKAKGKAVGSHVGRPIRPRRRVSRVKARRPRPRQRVRPQRMCRKTVLDTGYWA